MKANISRTGIISVLPMTMYIVFFALLPVSMILGLSFLAINESSQVVFQFSNFDNYLPLFQNDIYIIVLAQSLGIGLGTTVITLLVGYPVAYYIARVGQTQRNILLFLMLVPFWTNFVIRMYAWRTILVRNGFFNQALLGANIIDTPLNIFGTPTAVFIGMVYEFLLFMILPLYSSIEKVKTEQLDAASDLGASPIRTFFGITLPQTVPGIIAGVLFVLVPVMGFFAVVNILGGGNSVLIGKVIERQFLTTRDWPFGAAMAVILIIFALAVTFVYTRKAKFGEGIS